MTDALQQVNPLAYKDYTQLGLKVVFTDHAEAAIRIRGITREDVLYLLQVHDVDIEGDKPHKRELMGYSGRGRIKVVIALHLDAGEVRVVTLHQEPRRRWHPRR